MIWFVKLVRDPITDIIAYSPLLPARMSIAGAHRHDDGRVTFPLSVG